MEFKEEEFVDREIEIAGYLQNSYSLKHIKEITGLSKQHLEAHIKNMIGKLKAEDMNALIKFLKG